MHPSGNPELTEIIQFVAQNTIELKEILQFLMEREKLLEKPEDGRCDTEPPDWMLARIVPRDHGLDFELGEKLKNVEPSPLRKGGKSTILIKEQMENGWVHRFLYVAPTEKAMLRRLVALGFKNPGEQFTTWVKMAEGTKVIHV